MLKIGVIIASYNRENLIKNTIDSILNQTYKNFEICVIDDGSKIPVKESLKDYQYKNLKIITLDKNRGNNFARNIGIEYFLDRDVDFITFIDDDDEFLPNAFEKFVNDYKNNPNEKWFVYKVIDKNKNEISIFKETGKIDYVWYLWRIKLKKDAHHFVRKDLLNDVRFTCEFKNGQEWYFWAHLGKKTNMFVIDKIVKIVEYLPDGLSKNKDMVEYKNKYYFKKYVMKKLGYSTLKWKALKIIYNLIGY